jgi:NADH dehydrogenase
LAEYAYGKLTGRGIRILLGVTVKEADEGKIYLSNGDTLSSRTLVWSAGNSPNPVVASLSCSAGGSVVCDEYLRICGLSNAWGAGDCVNIINPETGKRYPPTAQHALREGNVLALNIFNTLKRRPLQRFSYETKGMLVALGHHSAVAEILGRRFSGLFAWWLWRTVYLYKLPGLERKLRVASDWAMDFVFPRDIVQTMNLARNPPLTTRHLLKKGI